MYYTGMDYREMFLDCGFNPPTKGNKLCRCPMHEDAHPSMSIDVNRGLFHCFSCGYSGRIDKVYYEKFGHAYGKKTSYNANELRELFSRKQRYVKAPTPAKKQYFTASIVKYNSPIFTQWLEFRGIKKSVADAAGAFYGCATIEWTDEDGTKKSYKVNDRVMFPIYDKDHKMCSLEMRFPFFGNENKRFKESVKKVLYPKCSSVNLLYEQDKLDKTKKLYLLEGLMDCLSFRSLTGIKNSTTIFGAMITDHQKELLNEFPEICYVYNNDPAGLNSLESMKKFYKGKLTELKPAGDCDDVGDMAKAKFTGVKEWLTQER